MLLFTAHIHLLTLRVKTHAHITRDWCVYALQQAPMVEHAIVSPGSQLTAAQLLQVGCQAQHIHRYVRGTTNQRQQQ
jgi:hypothetical protein